MINAEGKSEEKTESKMVELEEVDAGISKTTSTNDRIIAKDREIIVPGEQLAVGMSFVPGNGCYRDGDRIIASLYGMFSIEDRVLKVIQLAGKYVPREGDKIVGRVIDLLFTGWRVELNSAYSAMLSVKDATSEF